MLRRLSATPCPVNEPQAFSNRRKSNFSIGEDSTANIEFTTEFKASFRDVKPRRPPGKAKKPGKNDLGFTILEDEELHIQDPPRPQVKDCTGIRHAAHAISVGQAPQRPKQRVSFVQSNELNDAPANKPLLSSSLHRAPRRASLQIAAHADLRHGSIDDTLPKLPSPKISKPARRGTIYIPNDDTTMPSMYMGIFSPLRTSHNMCDEITRVHFKSTQELRRKCSRRKLAQEDNPYLSRALNEDLCMLLRNQCKLRSCLKIVLGKGLARRTYRLDLLAKMKG